LEEFKQELLAAWRQRVEAGGGGGIVAAKEVQQE
jgi:hypothetical protein